jgi:ubiquitin thioesterase protein OTUB1
MDHKEEKSPADVENHPDMMTLEQMEGIKQEIAAEQPMIGPFEPVDRLLHIYDESSSAGFIPGIKFLSERFAFMRRIRGDGNCFYRGLLFGYLDNLLGKLKSDDSMVQSAAEHEYERFSSKIRNSMNDLVSVGYSEFTIEVFYDELLEVLVMLKDQTTQSLLELFQEGGKADYITWYMRALTAGMKHS